MIRIKLPSGLPKYSDIIDECCSGRDAPYKQHASCNKEYLIQKGEEYKTYAISNKLYLFDTCILRNGCSLIVNDLTNDDMVELYASRLCKSRCLDIYDTLLNLAKNPEIRCPFCGGISAPSQIDHFLPKSRYGHVSVFPYNLIPICKDCNIEFKKEFSPKGKNEQLIHPYLDEDCFFDRQWLYAKYIDDRTDFGTVHYFINPPNEWSDDKKNKIKFHFEIFNLADRFSEISSGSLSDILVQMKSHKINGTLMQDFEKCNIDTVIARENKANHWKKALFQAVKDKITAIWEKI